MSDLPTPQPRDLPWEIVDYVFSFCDQATLAAVSLASFECWQGAGRILYQDVEVTDLNGLASLFFIKTTSASPRLNGATSHLSRIRTLRISISDREQNNEPRFPPPPSSDDDFDDDDDSDEEWSDVESSCDSPLVPLTPHRLLAYTAAPLPLQNLVVEWQSDVYHPGFQDFLPVQVFGHLNPVELKFLHPWAGGRRPPQWRRVGLWFPRTFLSSWTRLRTLQVGDFAVVWNGERQEDGEFWEHSLAYIWALAQKKEGQERKELDVVFDLTHCSWHRWDIEAHTAGGYADVVQKMFPVSGVTEEVVELVKLRAVVRVNRWGASALQEDLAAIPAWMKELVKVEIVEL